MYIRKLLLVLVLVVVLSVAVGGFAAAAEAAKGGGRTSPSLAVTQNGVQVTSVPASSAIEVRGAGFAAYSTVYVGLQGYFGLQAVTADASGNFAYLTNAPSIEGTYSYVAMRQVRKTWQIAATAGLQVTP